MVNIVKLVFELTVECDYMYADELGRDIAHDLLNSWDNGEDYLDWEFKESKLVI